MTPPTVSRWTGVSSRSNLAAGFLMTMASDDQVVQPTCRCAAAQESAADQAHARALLRERRRWPATDVDGSRGGVCTHDESSRRPHATELHKGRASLVR